MFNQTIGETYSWVAMVWVSSQSWGEQWFQKYDQQNVHGLLQLFCKPITEFNKYIN